ncbi:pentapeptide repeat-containing protein [Parafrankia discariae]|uniref:pentapeptide repeat-containing protein n=1 Tax=Parafrankia discariae TaxID=365528 RepID=UPI000374C461|nr:pentapeptide repeat-containing protein [Parafrankia discariae]
MADSGGSRRQTSRRWLWIIAGVAAAGAVCAVLGVWHLPERMYPGSYEEVGEARAALQGGLLTAAAALTAVAGGLIALDETRQANAETRRANTEISQANKNTHVRELYATAIELLGARTIDSRLGGIYALERVAVDSPADQRTVVEVLSAFVRVHSTDPVPPPNPPDPSSPIRPTVDVHAAITVLARLPVRAKVPRADLTGAWLVGANLTRAWTVGATLTGTQLDGTDLTRAWTVGAALTGAWLVGADLALARAWLDGATPPTPGSSGRTSPSPAPGWTARPCPTPGSSARPSPTPG